MERGICKLCQKFFIKIQSDKEICDVCDEKEREEYSIVKDYLFRNRNASIMEIYFNTKVSIKTLNRYIDEGKIHITDSNSNT